MPLSAEIKINGALLETVWIGRLEDFSGEDKSHLYVCGFGHQNLEAWNLPGVKMSDLPRFTHKYSDGAVVCVLKALEALEK